MSQTLLSRLQDLQNTKLNKTPVGGGGGGYRAPGGPATSPPPNKALLPNETDFFPRPSSPTRPHSSSSGSSGPFIAGRFLDPELLVNKSPSELPEGVDPTQKEVCVSGRLSVNVDLSSFQGINNYIFRNAYICSIYCMFACSKKVFVASFGSKMLHVICLPP